MRTSKHGNIVDIDPRPRLFGQRGDFSRWIADVFGDHALARELQNRQRAYVHTK